MFVFNSILFGVGLAMDAFSVSIANGLHDPVMSRRRQLTVAGTFSFFQFIMPVIGWGLVHTIISVFRSLEKCIPFIALILLLYIGGKMLWEGFRKKDEEEEAEAALTAGELLLQGIATSIDALSVGFTISEYDVKAAFLSAAIIAAVTFLISLTGLLIGKRFGMRLAGRADILGGVILIAIGMEIFVKGIIA